MIRMKGIEKYYSSGSIKTFVLRDVDLEIREKEFVVIMGLSGAGKSTPFFAHEWIQRFVDFDRVEPYIRYTTENPLCQY